MFLNAKRLFRNSASDENKMIFLEARRAYVQEKRKAKLIFCDSQKSKLSEMGKKHPSNFGKISIDLEKTKVLRQVVYPLINFKNILVRL